MTTGRHNTANVLDAPMTRRDHARLKDAGVHEVPRNTALVAASDASVYMKALAWYQCDGEDDDVQIQAAIDAIPSSGGAVSLSEGTFTLGARVQIANDDIAIRGQGMSTIITIEDDFPLSQDAIRFLGASRVELAMVQLVGNRTGQSALVADNGQNGVTFDTCNDYSLRDVYAKDWAKDAWQIATSGGSGNSTQGRIYNVTADNCRRNGASISASDSDQVRDVDIIACSFINTTGIAPQSGFDIEPNQNTNVITDVRFIGCHFQDNAKTGCLVDNGAGATVERIQVIGGSSYSNDDYGVQFNAVNEGLILGVGSKDNTTASRMGIYLKSCNDSIVSACISEGDTQCIRVDGGARNKVVGCSAKGPTANVSVDVVGGATDTLIEGNHGDGQFLATGNGTDRTVIRGNTALYDNAAAIETADSADLTLIEGNQITGASGSVTDGGTNSIIRRNNGYATENSGTATITNGTTSVVVTHGLDITPTLANISITLGENPSNDPGNIWVDTFTSTQFTVNCRNDPGASNLDTAWRAMVL